VLAVALDCIDLRAVCARVCRVLVYSRVYRVRALQCTHSSAQRRLNLTLCALPPSLTVYVCVCVWCHRCTARQETLVRGVVPLRLARPAEQVSLPLARVSTQHVYDSRMQMMMRWCFAGKYSEDNSGATVCTDCEAAAGSFCPSGSSSSAAGVPCPTGSYCPGTSSDKVPCPTGKTSAAGSTSRDGCTDIVVSSSQTTVVLDVVLPYSREAFTEAVQDKFRIGMAAAAKAGCKCEVTKSEVIIKNIQAEPAAAPGTRRLLSAAAGITVGVSILLPNLQAGNLLVQSGALSKEGVNNELDKVQVERVTSVSSPVLSSGASNGDNNTSSASSSGGQPVASFPVGMIVGLVVGVVVLVVTAVVAFRLFRPKKAVTPSDQFVDTRPRRPQSTTDASLDDLIKQLTEAAGELKLDVSRSEGKYEAQTKILLGTPKMAASGIAMFVNFPGGLEALQKQASEGLEAVKQEILASGSQSAIELMNYILDEEAGSCKKKYQNGWMCDCEDGVVLVDAPLTLEGGIVVDKGVKGEVLKISKDGNTGPGPPSWGGARIDFGGTIGKQWVSKDQFQNLVGVVLPSRQIADPAAPGGKRGMLFKDFCEHKIAKDCYLTPSMVFVLRFYTTWGYEDINSPLRDPDLWNKKTSHKLAVTVYQLDMAIRQSRRVAADSDDANVPLSLFRGIKEREMPNDFKTAGGTELAPMSTVRKFCMYAHACHLPDYRVSSPSTLEHMWR
jgi:hypothetical protein